MGPWATLCTPAPIRAALGDGLRSSEASALMNRSRSAAPAPADDGAGVVHIYGLNGGRVEESNGHRGAGGCRFLMSLILLL